MLRTLRTLRTLWRAMNAITRAGRNQAGEVTFTQSLSAVLLKRGGTKVDLGVVSRRVVTTAGVKFLVDNFAAAGPNVGTFKYHAMGTGTNSEDPADTALQTEVETRAAGSQASATAGANATYTTVGTIAFTGPHAITEHGIFSAAAAGTLWDRSKFLAINGDVGDAIQFTYVLTANSGG